MVQDAAATSQPTARATEKKREILRAASRVFRAQGLHSTTMRDIAAELGMHVGNLYYYFSGKDALLAFCQQDALEALLALAESVRGGPGEADEKLRRLIIGHVVCLNEQTPGSLAHLEAEALPPPYRDEVLAGRATYEAAILDILEEGMTRGVLRPFDSRVVAKAILGAANWTVKWYRTGGDRTAAEIGAEIADFLVCGLRLEANAPTTAEARDES